VLADCSIQRRGSSAEAWAHTSVSITLVEGRSKVSTYPMVETVENSTFSQNEAVDARFSTSVENILPCPTAAKEPFRTF